MGSRRSLQNWNTREVRKLRKRLAFSRIQKAVLIGLILGDGAIVENVAKKNYRLQIEQGKDRKEYVFWLYRIFKKWVLKPPQYDQKRNSWRFRTISHPEITRYRKIFYHNGRKIIPSDIDNYLTDPLTLAVWFMDDGGKMRDKKREYGNLFNVQQFSLEEVRRLQKVLERKFGLFTTLQWNNSGYRLYLGKKRCQKFNKLIGSYINPIFRYKLLLTP
ncbi:hypothetical protein J7K44_03165 [bacterium]|nr:hypothetical protein [bacterium]